MSEEAGRHAPEPRGLMGGEQQTVVARMGAWGRLKADIKDEQS